MHAGVVCVHVRKYVHACVCVACMLHVYVCACELRSEKAGRLTEGHTSPQACWGFSSSQEKMLEGSMLGTDTL